MNSRKFVCVGEAIPKIETTENADFIIHLQKSMLLSLVKRELLTLAQMERVMEEIERQYRKPMP